MPPTTRNQTARIAGFPDISPDAQTLAFKTRPVPTQDATASLNHSPPTSSVVSDAIPPTYTIDLSLPPAERYVQAATDYKAEINNLTGLFEEVLDMMGIPLKPASWLSWIFLRKLYNKEQTEEIRGVSQATGVQMYLLVAFNTLLDLFMGCTSGGVKVLGDDKHDTRMLHFRTLDWGMDALRKVIVQLEFVEKTGGPVIARSITYVGFVGILTGVRPDLSVSLNFRPYHNNDSSKAANFRFYSNHLLVLLGFRPSISSTLRDLIIPTRATAKPSLQVSGRGEKSSNSTNALPSIDDVMEKLPSVPTTVAYLIFCSGEQTVVIEKDHDTAQTHRSKSFLVATNHDAASELDSSGHTSQHSKQMALAGMQDLVHESQDRKGCMVALWQKAVKRYKVKYRGSTEDDVAVQTKDVIKWIQRYPTTNEQTHYACVMDPTEGTILWVNKYNIQEEIEDIEHFPRRSCGPCF